jgi:KDO2-lipid IV(A) lauroyltransferase
MKFWFSFLDWAATNLTINLFNFVSTREEKAGINFCLFITKAYLFFRPQLKRAAVTNISLVFPEMPAKEKLKFIEGSVKILAENLFWFSRLRKLSREELRALIDYREAQPIYDKILTYPVGALILAPHFGLFELLAQGQAVYGRPYTALIRDFGMPRLDKFWKGTRSKFGLTTFGRKGGYKDIIKNINEGREVAVLYDQNVKRNHAAFVELFGIPAATTKSIALAAIRTNCPVVFAACIENPPEEQKYGRFKIYVREIPNPNVDPDLKDKNGDEKVLGFLRKANQELETLIRLQPAGWFWIHRRWKTRPEGEPENFYD